MKVLIVDDSKAMRMIVQRTLRQAGLEFASVAEATNGEEALTMLRANPVDLVLSDWNMPQMSGLELLTAVRSEKLPVHFGFVTSESTPAMRQTATDAGAEFLIGKPFTSDVFEQTLRPFMK